jgi:hypothetical protein
MVSSWNIRNSSAPLRTSLIADTFGSCRDLPNKINPLGMNLPPSAIAGGLTWYEAIRLVFQVGPSSFVLAASG